MTELEQHLIDTGSVLNYQECIGAFAVKYLSQK